ncbi:recQ mediated genome instability protein [Hirsutella rhossiliensis]|uniref:RecQ mediated genome instability protein n=1 Tax=Hirsutella rhossiliensis TaxID=111463 RepID=A0A9P8SF63_9HYPO|nr:recQ mediated genome instability protein [Hirsutella rhossiliensis]KAH0959734.1 recQ mediated genome instability protein [Hirsutella rhossiliensis]
MDLIPQLRASLLANSLPAPSTAFLTTLVASRSPPPPLPSLLATAKARLLACDLASPSSAALLDPSLLPALPADAADAAAASTKLPRDVHVQVLDVENLSLARWDQIEQLEAVARGERSRGRQVVRVAADADDDDDGANGIRDAAHDAAMTEGDGPPPQRAAAAAGAGAGAGPYATHRLVLQDCQGSRVYAIELRRIDRIGVGKTTIGEKMLLRAGTVVARGIVLLTPETCLPLGGRVEAWHEAWAEGRLQRLNEAVGGHRPR